MPRRWYDTVWFWTTYDGNGIQMMGVAGGDAPHELSPKYAIQAVEQDGVEGKT